MKTRGLTVASMWLRGVPRAVSAPEPAGGTETTGHRSRECLFARLHKPLKILLQVHSRRWTNLMSRENLSQVTGLYFEGIRSRFEIFH